MESFMISQEGHQRRFAHLTGRSDSVAISTVDSPSDNVIRPHGDLTWSLTSSELLERFTTRPKNVQEETVLALSTLLQLISPSAQSPHTPIVSDWVIRRVPSCTPHQLDALDRIMQYEGGRRTSDVLDGPTPISQSSCERNIAEMYSLFKLPAPEKIKPIDIANLDECLAGLCATLHLTKEWLVLYKAPESTKGPSSNTIALVMLGGALWGTTHTWMDKDIGKPKKSLHKLGIDVYADVRSVCSQDMRQPLLDAALDRVNENMRVIRESHPHATLLVWAWSAGGFVAACSNPPADIYILMYPVLSMEDGLTDEGTQRRALGRDATDEDKQKASAQISVEKMRQAKLYVYHSIEDEKVPISPAIDLAEGIYNGGGSVSIDFAMGGPHGGCVNHQNIGTFIAAATSGKLKRQEIDFTMVRGEVGAKRPVRIPEY